MDRTAHLTDDARARRMARRRARWLRLAARRAYEAAYALEAAADQLTTDRVRAELRADARTLHGIASRHAMAAAALEASEAIA
jgi:hypothetical protein